LAERYGLFHYKTSDSLLELARERKIPSERNALQKFGESLDRKTNGEWVVNGLANCLIDKRDVKLVVVDAVRIQKQIDAFRAAYGLNVLHIHLTAPEEELEHRYLARGNTKIREFKS
jgi:adenylosuccinate synthase